MTTPSPQVADHLDRRVSVAPMMDWTDRYCRNFLRVISKRTLLYTEMVTTGAILHGDRDRHLGFDDAEHPVAVQLGGSDPVDLAEAAAIAEQYGYDEINLNVGCPSDRVQSGRFGACLMTEPALVGDCISAMQQRVGVPVTVKTRIGVDEQDRWEDLERFVRTVADAGCLSFTIHARKAWLKGLSPKENREIPPLRYDVAARVKQAFPELEVILNGGVKTLADIQSHLDVFDGVMIGREAYQNPYLLAQVDRVVFGCASEPLSREDIIEAYLPFIERELAAGTPLNRMTRHMLGLFHGMPGGRRWRRTISEQATKKGAGTEVLRAALEAVGSIEDAA
ncbi:MAG: tRNA dihydrouridine(20/20a) synthase DusA [Gammaproteobacteria bacterium]|nr:tRNA dihydrouridine(20/20a) synthase DusA [Gammaproteobacteria bacterium]